VAVGSQRVLRGLAGEVGGLLRRHWFAALLPAAILGAGADVVFLVRHDIGAEIAVGLALVIAFELYVGYAELIIAADRSTGVRPPITTMLWRALPVTPALVIASLEAVTVPLAATGLLIIPGLWLLTRWSLFAPAIVHEKLGPIASLRRSNQLVRGVFWAVALTVSLSVLVEHAVIHASAHAAEPLLGSVALGLIAAGLVTALVSAPAAFTISVVYERLAGDVHAGEGSGRTHPRPEQQAAERSAHA
jgi:hypothetical protein